MNPAFGAKRLGHRGKQFLPTYPRWIDEARDAEELAMQQAPATPIDPV